MCLRHIIIHARIYVVAPLTLLDPSANLVVDVFSLKLGLSFFEGTISFAVSKENHKEHHDFVQPTDFAFPAVQANSLCQKFTFKPKSSPPGVARSPS